MRIYKRYELNEQEIKSATTSNLAGRRILYVTDDEIHVNIKDVSIVAVVETEEFE